MKPRSENKPSGYTATFEHRNAGGEEVTSGGYASVIDGVQVDLFSCGVLAAVLLVPVSLVYDWQRVGFPRPMYRVAGSKTGLGRVGYYSRNQIAVARKMWVESRKDDPTSRVALFIRRFREVFYALDAPSELHHRLLSATRKGMERATQQER